jgi:flavin-dependent dehydrogenase
MTSCDVVVIGGGPAGAAAARLLASWDYSVVVLARPSRHSLAESLPPSCIKLFDTLGVRDAVDRAGFVRATGNTVHWAGATERVEFFPSGAPGYQVSRDAFDSLLRAGAAAAGALVVDDATVRTVERAADGSATVTYDASDGAHTLRARWTLDCSGRSGVVARHGWRRADHGARTTALIGMWERAGGWRDLVPDDSHTLVESYEGGWAWSVPCSATRRFFTVMVDPRVTPLPGAAQLASAYHAELARTERLRALRSDASLIAPAFARDASPYAAERYAEPGTLLVGDAASFVDPLSSYGVKKALASAWLAAVVVNSAISDPRIGDQALALFGARERAIYDHLQRQAAALSRDASVAYASDFWLGRSAVDDEQPDAEVDVAALRRDPRVVAAFEDIRERPSVHLRAAGLHIAQRAIVRGNRVAVEDHLVVSGLGESVRYLRSIDLVLLCRLAPQYDQVPDLFEAYNRSAPPTSLPDFLGALSALVGFEVLAFA